MEKQFDDAYLQLLAHKWKEGSLSPEEQEHFDAWYNQYQDEHLELPEGYAKDPAVIRERMLARLRERIEQSAVPATTKTVKLPMRWISIVAAASLFIIIGFLIYSYVRRQKEDHAIQQQSAAINVAPGSNKAMLTLADGRTINLQEAAAGELAAQSGIRISKTAEGQVVYTVTGSNDHSEINTIKTPKGGQYRLRLPDNTEVWLNAASTLQYPASFNGRDERSVTLSGEAYFRVAKDKAHPFIVKTKDQAIKVLGTHFNINSYSDEGKTVTTLEEGSVQVKAGAELKILRPGEQSILGGNNSLSVRQADMSAAMAWTKNEMVFNDAGVQEIMRQIARWYDLDIEYQGRIPDDTISGTVDRRENLAAVLKMFATMQIHFTLEQTPTGKKLIIKP
nr:FecR domain-containing protein [Pedobacter sp. ASV19]